MSLHDVQLLPSNKHAITVHLCCSSCQYKFTVFSSSATSLLIHPEESSEVHTATPRECFALKILLSRCKFEKKRRGEKRENSVFNNAQCEMAQSNIHF